MAHADYVGDSVHDPFRRDGRDLRLLRTRPAVGCRRAARGELKLAGQDKPTQLQATGPEPEHPTPALIPIRSESPHLLSAEVNTY